MTLTKVIRITHHVEGGTSLLTFKTTRPVDTTPFTLPCGDVVTTRLGTMYQPYPTPEGTHS